MKKEHLYIIILIILQSLLIRAFPAYWLVFLAIGILIFERMLIKLEVSIIKRSSVRISKLNTVDTHFLFNAINTIMYFCRIDGNEARRLLLDLGEYLRYFMSEEACDTKLSQEYKVLKSYLNIQKARFGEKMSFNMEELEDEHIINKGFLINLSYYALKRGVINSKTGGEIEIYCSKYSGYLKIILLHSGNSLEDLGEYKKKYFEKFRYKLQGSLKDGDKTELSLEIPLNNIL